MKILVSTLLVLLMFISCLEKQGPQFFFNEAQAGFDSTDLITVSIAAVALVGLGVLIFNKKDKKKVPEKTRLIMDTDMAEEAMDAGALALLHSLSNKGLVEILAVMQNSRSNYAANSITSINQYYKNTEIQVGSYKGDIGTDVEGKYNLILLEKNNTGVNRSTTKKAFELYRSLLEKSKDESVTILSLGYLSNLYELMKSPADEFSELNGMELITKKVKKLVVAGGKLPSGMHFNFVNEGVGPFAIYTINHWPTEIIFVTEDLSQIQTHVTPLSDNNPVKVAYINQGSVAQKSLDLIAAFYAVKGPLHLFTLHSNGQMFLNEDGSNIWKETPDKKHSYLKKNQSDETIAYEINQLLHFNPEN